MIKQPMNVLTYVAVLLCFGAGSAMAQETAGATAQSARPARHTTAKQNGKPGETNSINPQPLPPRPSDKTQPVPVHAPPSPRPDWTAAPAAGSAPIRKPLRSIKPGDASSINPQPLPPRPAAAD